jgi:hypothetical protein
MTVKVPDAIVLELKVPFVVAVPTASPFLMMAAVSENESSVIGTAALVEIRIGWHPVSWYVIEWEVIVEPLTVKARRRP